MSKFTEWQKSKADLKSAKSWVSNRSKKDSQDGRRYAKVQLQSLKLEYCGQAYAGANNYHESPESFNKYLAKAVGLLREKIEDEALKLLEAESNEKAILANDEVSEMMDEISAISGDK
jgi:hypothetical protein